MPVNEHLVVVSGKSKYIDDITLPNTVYLGIVRSPYARAVIKEISRPSKALLFITGKELKAFLPAIPVPNANIVKMPVFAEDRVNFVGQPVTAVVSEDRYELFDIIDEIGVEYEELKPVTTIEEALKGDIIIHSKSNIAVDQELKGGYFSLQKDYDVVVERKIYQNRIIGNPMETRGCLVNYDGEKLIVYASTQSALSSL
jgi:CO/xanthine dehydrogenase Mo-binding subunit